MGKSLLIISSVITMYIAYQNLPEKIEEVENYIKNKKRLSSLMEEVNELDHNIKIDRNKFNKKRKKKRKLKSNYVAKVKKQDKILNNKKLKKIQKKSNLEIEEKSQVLPKDYKKSFYSLKEKEEIRNINLTNNISGGTIITNLDIEENKESDKITTKKTIFTGNDIVEEYINEKLKFDPLLLLNVLNKKEYKISGSCDSSLDEKVILNLEDYSLSLDCLLDRWETTLDLKLFANPSYKIFIEQNGYEIEEKIYNSEQVKLVRHYSFDKENYFIEEFGYNLKEDENILRFILNKDKGIKLNNSYLELDSLFNKEFSERTYFWTVYLDNLIDEQIIFNEGGATHGFTLKIKNSKLYLYVVQSDIVQEFNLDILKGGKQEIIVSFKNKDLFFKIGEEFSYNTIIENGLSAHSDTSGILRNYGSDSSGNSDSLVSSIGLFDFKIFNEYIDNNNIFKLYDVPKNFKVDKDFQKLKTAYFFKEDSLLNDIKGNYDLNSVNGNLTYEGLELLNDPNAQLSDGSYLNDETKYREINLKIQFNDITNEQFIFDEGGSTNGFALRVKNGKLEFVVSDKKDRVYLSLNVQENIWHTINASFNDGELKLKVDEEEVKETSIYTKISRHSDRGGYFSCYGSNAFAENCSNKDLNATVEYLKIY